MFQTTPPTLNDNAPIQRPLTTSGISVSILSVLFFFKYFFLYFIRKHCKNKELLRAHDISYCNNVH